MVVVSLYCHSLVGMHLISFILLLYTQCYYVQTFIEKQTNKQTKLVLKSPQKVVN